jgi:hypothetical protein
VPDTIAVEPSQAPAQVVEPEQFAEFESDVDAVTPTELAAIVEAQSDDAQMADEVAPPQISSVAIEAEASIDPAAPSESVQTQSAEATLQPEAQPAQTTARPTDSLDATPLATSLAIEPEQMPTSSPDAIDPLATSEPQDAAADAAPPVPIQTEFSQSRAGASIPNEDLRESVAPSESDATSTREASREVQSRAAASAPAPTNATDVRFAAPNMSLTPAERNAATIAPTPTLSNIDPSDASPPGSTTATESPASAALAVVDPDMVATPTPNEAATTRSEEAAASAPVRVAAANQPRVDTAATQSAVVEEVSIDPLTQTSEHCTTDHGNRFGGSR